MTRLQLLKVTIFALTAAGVSAAVYRTPADRSDLPNRMPMSPPYIVAEAQAFPPPFEEHWEAENSPAQCQSCHTRIFEEWNGSMMANAWRDPVWRGAFLLSSREVSANGNCDTPEPPDGTAKANHNPFAKPDECASIFDIGTRKHTVSRSGSLVDDFCSQCHMPANYVDNVPLRTVKIDRKTGRESASMDLNFNPTSDNGTGIAFATLDTQFRNTDAGKSGVFCAVCHTLAATRDTPYHNYIAAPSQYTHAAGRESRSELVAAAQQDVFHVPDGSKSNLGYSIGTGAFRLSPHAIGFPERLGPLSATPAPPATDAYLSSVFGQALSYGQVDSAKHKGFHHVMFTRAELCAACHDVTNGLPIKNSQGKWVGGFPIERTYTEWASSRYADRPGNTNFQPRFKRDCQNCHMQQDYGQPGTAQTLYRDGKPLPPPVERVANDGAARPFFTHHFVGGNTYVPHIIGADIDTGGNVSPYPELSNFSFSSANPKSVYSNAYWMNADSRGNAVQQSRLAWDRLRHVVELTVQAPWTAPAGSSVPLAIRVTNSGSGHNFPTGFPEGRIGWLAVRAYDLATGNELRIYDSHWNRTTKGVGALTTAEMNDPNYPPRCAWKVPAGSADPYSVQFKAVASLGDGCPTLDLVYAAPLNLVTNKRGLPVDARGELVDNDHPDGLPQFRDVNGNGDLYDDAFLKDTRLRPLPHPGATVNVDRYSVVIPRGTVGPVAVSAAVYYQSVEGVVALKFLGNLADTNGNFVLEPCVLGGNCDGRIPRGEPAVVEGSPPVPMAVRNWVITLQGAQPDSTPPTVSTYPQPDATGVYQDVVVKAFFSKPVRNLDAHMFTLADSQGALVPASIDQIGDGTWGLFPDQVFLKGGERYTVKLDAGICDTSDHCTTTAVQWSFQVHPERGKGTGDSSIPLGYAGRRSQSSASSQF